jgi:mono/diheme cytochrome c family protein
MDNRLLLATIAVFSVLLSSLGVSAIAQRGPSYGMHRGDYWNPGWMHRDMWGRWDGPSEMRARMQRHWTFMHEGIPEIYENAQSPLAPTTADIEAGGTLYVQNCASCHGASGMGDGEAGKSLTPSPALLAWMIQRPVAVDEYLLWTISEGGTEFKTGMPAFKDTLSREEIWKIVAYMRAGFPDVEQKVEGQEN